MRIAVAFAGQPRYYQHCYEHNYPHVFEGREIDTYCHLWHDPETEGGQYQASSHYAGHSGGPIQAHADEAVIDLLQPLRYVVQPQVQFEIKEHYVDNRADNPHNFANFSWPYALREVGKLVARYEDAHSFKYDRVVVMRYDLEIDARLPIEDASPDTLYTIDTGPSYHHVLADQLWITGSEVARQMPFSLWDHMHTYFSADRLWNTERAGLRYCQEAGINYHRLSIPYRIYRGH